jgi:acetyl-CoA acetyltransferase
MVSKERAKVAVVGLGHSSIYRRDEIPLGRLAVDACLQAIADAGITVDEIDGLASDPEQPFGGAGHVDGSELVTPDFMTRALRLQNLTWSEHTQGIMAMWNPLFKAINAVASGACNTALVFRAMHSPSRSRYGHTSTAVASDEEQYSAPYGVFPPTGAGLLWQQYMSKYGRAREDMADVVLNARRYGLLWEHGYWYQYRPEQLSREDYLAARMISWPVSLYDCDIPVQGAGAFVVTNVDRAADLCDNPAYILGTAQSTPKLRHGTAGPVMMGSRLEPLQVVEARAARLSSDLWRSTGLQQSDIDVVNVYDGFSIFVPMWIEGLGFCGAGEALSFITLERTGVGGDFPLNTSGGSLGAGRMHGVPQLMDGALQVMGRSGSRQVPGAELSLVVIGPPKRAGGIVFSNHP